MSEPFIAEVRMFTCNYAPRSWTWCQGQMLQISSNVALYAVISTIYGGNGRVTMALPDLKGRVPIHHGRAPGLREYRQGYWGGWNRVGLSQKQLPQHDHQLTAVNKAGVAPAPTAGESFLSKDTSLDGSLYFLTNQQQNHDAITASETLADAGESLEHENRQPFLAIHFCIALDGVFPSRS